MARTAYGGFDDGADAALGYGGQDATRPEPVAAARDQDLRRQIVGVVDHDAIANKLSENNDASELHSSPHAVQVLVEGAKAGDPIPLAPGVMAARGGRNRNLSAVVGIVAASTAVTALAGGAVSPTVAFGSFLVLLGGLAVAMASVRTSTT